MATKDRTSLKNDFANGKYATGEKFADLIDSMKVVQLPVVDPQALGTSLSFIDSISQDEDGKITATKKTLDLANAHELNPFKGWYKTGDTLPTDGFDGAYLYFKDTTQTPVVTTIYQWNGTAYVDTGTEVDESYVNTFGSGQALNDVKIKNENGEDVTGPAGVLSAEAALKIFVAKAINRGYLNPVNGTITQDSSFLASEFIPFLTDLYFYKIYVGRTVGLCFYDKYQKFIGSYDYGTTTGEQDIVLSKSSYPNVAFVRFSTKTSANGWCRLSSEDGTFNNISNIISIITSVYGDYFTIEGYLLKADGSLYPSSGKYVTDFIPINPNNDLTVYAYGYQQTYLPVIFYDENRVKVGSVANTVAAGGGMALYQILSTGIPSTAKYIRCGASKKGIGFILSNTLAAVISDVYSKINEDKPVYLPYDRSNGLVLHSYYKYTAGVLGFTKTDSISADFNSKKVEVELGDIVEFTGVRGRINTAATGLQLANLIIGAHSEFLGYVEFIPKNDGSGLGTYTVDENFINLGGKFIGLSFSSVSSSNMGGTMRKIIVKKSLSKLPDEIDTIKKIQKERPRIPNYVFKGIASNIVKDKIMSMDDDVNILLLGDSMTALTNVAGAILPNAANLPAGCNRDAITYQLWNRLCTNKPQCDRFDSTVNQFTETGTWSLSDLDKFKKNADGTTTEKGMGEYSDDNCITHETETQGDSVSFEWNLNDYEKLNFIHRLSAYDGTTGVTIAVTQGDGNIEVYNRNSSSWVEANGYVFSQKLSATDSDTAHNGYTACWIRNYPLKMRRKSGASGNVTLTFTNTGNGTFYYWGTERYNFTTVRITNIARAGRNLELLWRNIGREVTLRDVDLIIFQLPLWNEFKGGGNVLPTVISRLNGIISDLSTYSTIDNSSFAKFQVVFNLYHTQSFSWEGNKNIQFYSNGDRTKTPTNLPDYQLETKIEKALKDLISSNHEGKLSVANLIGVFYQIALSNGISMEEFLSQYNYDFGVKPFTVDGVHLTSVGHNYYAELIAPMLE